MQLFSFLALLVIAFLAAASSAHGKLSQILGDPVLFTELSCKGDLLNCVDQRNVMRYSQSKRSIPCNFLWKRHAP